MEERSYSLPRRRGAAAARAETCSSEAPGLPAQVAGAARASLPRRPRTAATPRSTGTRSGCSCSRSSALWVGRGAAQRPRAAAPRWRPAAARAFGAWALLSISWAGEAAAAWDGANRALLYAATVRPVRAVARARTRSARWLVTLARPRDRPDRPCRAAALGELRPTRQLHARQSAVRAGRLPERQRRALADGRVRLPVAGAPRASDPAWCEGWHSARCRCWPRSRGSARAADRCSPCPRGAAPVPCDHTRPAQAARRARAERARGGARRRARRWTSSTPRATAALPALVDDAARAILLPQPSLLARGAARSSRWRAALDTVGRRAASRIELGGRTRSWRSSRWPAARVAATQASDIRSELSERWEEFKSNDVDRGGKRPAELGRNEPIRLLDGRLGQLRARAAARGRDGQLPAGLPAAAASSHEKPRYPHSFPLALLSETGIVGAPSALGAGVASRAGGGLRCTAAPPPGGGSRARWRRARRVRVLVPPHLGRLAVRAARRWAGSRSRCSGSRPR